MTACTKDAPKNEEYAGFWCGGSCSGTQILKLPAGYNTAKVTMGMHYSNAKCRGLVALNGHPLFDGR